MKIPSRWRQRPGPGAKGVPRCHGPDILKLTTSTFFKVVMVMFVGGCTMAEVAALRFLSQQVIVSLDLRLLGDSVGFKDIT